MPFPDDQQNASRDEAQPRERRQLEDHRLDDASARKATLDAFQLILGRDPDPGTVAKMIDALKGGDLSVRDLVRDLLDHGSVRSREVRDEQARRFVVDLYELILDRAPDPDGLALFTTTILSGALSPLEAVRDFLKSEEWGNRMRGPGPDADDAWKMNEHLVSDLYRRILLREADSEGLKHFGEMISLGTLRPADLLASLLASEEFGRCAIRHPMVAQHVARTTIETLMARDPGAQAVDAYAGSLSSGYGLAEFLGELIGSDEFKRRVGTAASPCGRVDSGGLAEHAESLIIARLLDNDCKLALPPMSDTRAPVGEKQIKSMLQTIAMLAAA